VSESFDFGRVSLVTVGAVGPKGKREFYLQLKEGTRLVSLLLEKDQLRVLAQRLKELLPQQTAASRSNMELEEPLRPVWRLGMMTLAYDQESGLFEVSMVELAQENEKPASGHFLATAVQMAALAHLAEEVVAAGRPPCPMCGGPMDHDGGVCPRLNGHH
jgi:uncharacterized repeat protein (TIGR03847 family)